MNTDILYTANTDILTNSKFSETDPTFLDWCEKSDIEPTKRQASKWRRGFGKAFKNFKLYMYNNTLASIAVK